MSKKKQKKYKNKKKKSSALKNNKISKATSITPYRHDVPVLDFLEDNDIETAWGLSQCIDNLSFFLRQGYFHRWEAVVRKEQMLPLTKNQQVVLDELIDFFDDGEDQILYIDELPRPSEPWYEILRKVAPKLILAPFETFQIYNAVYHEGWLELVECLENDVDDLSLPQGITSPIEVIPAEIRHKLTLQYYCFDTLSGLGQEEELTLANEEQKPWRIETFINSLKEHKDSIDFFNLSLEGLLELVILPPTDRNILIDSVMKKLKLQSISEKLASVL